MADTKDLIAKRKEAYDFIKNTLKNPPWLRSLDTSDIDLAEYLIGEPKAKYVSALTALREGKSNPTEELVRCFKDLCHNVVAEPEINQYLVDPFK